ncbi:MAG: antitoxin family protein [Planctomycetota bacterium]
MEQHTDAIYEDGVLRPLSPLSFANHERVSLTVRPLMIDDEDWVDRDFLAEAEADESVSLEQVRHALAKIQGGLTKSFREERDQR